MTSGPSRKEPGTLKRAAELLRLLSTGGRSGVSLTDLSKATGLPHPTVHRLLKQLMAERLASQYEESRRYALGALAFELGVAAAPYFDVRDACRPQLMRLAEEAGDTAFFSTRSGDESVCLDLQQGPLPIRVVTLQVGSRRPLGFGAGGLAMLGALERDERDAVVARVLPTLQADWRLAEKELRVSLKRFDDEGFAWIRNRVHLGVSAVGLPLRDPLGRPFAAISVAALNERMRPVDLVTLLPRIRAAVEGVEARLRRR